MTADSRAPRPGTAPLWWGPVAVAAFWVHSRAGFGFPRPWPDESHFLAPAIAVARSATLAVPALAAPDGIFWLPHGYYVLLAPLVWLPGDLLVLGRALSLLGSLLFAGWLAEAARRAGVPTLLAFAVPAAWLFLPRVVLSSNIVRMDTAVLALAGLAVSLAAHRRDVAALAVSTAAALLHPIGIAIAVAVWGGVLWTRRSAGVRWWEWVLAASVAVAVLADAAYFLSSSGLAREHLSFQVTRKAARDLTLSGRQQLTVALAAAAGVYGLARSWRRPDFRVPLLFSGLAAGLAVVELVGREMWYAFLGAETVVLLLVLAALSARPELSRRTAPVLVVAAVAVAGFGLRGVYAGDEFSMRTGLPAYEWIEFVGEGRRALGELDADGGAPATVLVDPLSGFGAELFDRPWRRLRFVQPTPVTPVPTTDVDYVLTTPGAPFVTESLAAEVSAAPPVVAVTSDSGAFRLEVRATP